MTVYICAMGFNTTALLNKLGEINPTSEDKIILVWPKLPLNAPESYRNKRRIAENSVFKTLIERIENIKYHVLDVDDHDVFKTINDILDVLDSNEVSPNEDIIILALGSTRSLAIILSIYGQIDPRVKKIYTFSENMGVVVEIPLINEQISNDEEKMKRIVDILRRIEEGEGVDDYSKNILTKLSNKGLIIKMKGKGDHYIITDKGRIIRKIYEKMLSGNKE